MLADALALAAKDVRIELRTHGALAAAIALGLVGLVVAGLALGPDLERLRSLAAGLTWLTLLYAAIAVADRLDRLERESDAFAVLWLGVPDRRSIFLGKTLALTLLLAVVSLVLWNASYLLLNLEASPLAVGLVPLALLAGLALAAPAVLVTAIIGTDRQRTLLLPVTLLPLLVPVLLAATEASSGFIAGSLDAALRWTALLGLIGVLLLGVGLLLYEPAAGPD